MSTILKGLKFSSRVMQWYRYLYIFIVLFSYLFRGSV